MQKIYVIKKIIKEIKIAKKRDFTVTLQRFSIQYVQKIYILLLLPFVHNKHFDHFSGTGACWTTRNYAAHFV